tara:strand:+ start:17715 stop:18299 length:585 start_codon:yes stop_codon:yes gene_type:complete
MKRVLKFTVMAALVFNTITAMANEPKMKLVADNEAKSLVFELDITSKDTKIQFVDSDNNVIYSDYNFATKGLRKKFDLSKLQKGVYTFKMDNATKLVTYTILIEENGISILEKAENTKPIFRVKEGMVFINLLNRDMQKVDIKVYDASDRLLFSEAITDKLVVEKAINFKKAFKGEYTITVKDTNGVYSKNINI